MEHHLFLPLDDVRQLCVGDSGIELTLHEGGALIVLDVTKVTALGHFDVFGKTLQEQSKWTLAKHSHQTNEIIELKSQHRQLQGAQVKKQEGPFHSERAELLGGSGRKGLDEGADPPAS